MHVARGVLAGTALRRRPLRAARPRILDPCHWCCGLGRCGMGRLLAPTWLAVRSSLRLAIAATVLAVTVVAATVVAVTVAVVSLVPALAMTACARGSFTLGCCRWLAHPGNALADQR